MRGSHGVLKLLRVPAALMVVFALVAAACGDDDDDVDAAPTTEAPAPEPAVEEPEPEPVSEEPEPEPEPVAEEPAAEEEMAEEAIVEEEMAEEEMAEEEEAMAFTDVCPAKIVVQTNWFPEAEHGGTYQVIGPDGIIDGENGTYRGPLAGTGLELEVRAGSQFIGFQPVTSVMYQDPEIFFGYVDGGESIQQSGANPTIAVMANLEISPLAMLWDPGTYSFTSIEDIRDEGVTVLHFDPSVSIEYFVETGQLSQGQLDASFDGSPAAFLASNGGIVFQSFATNAPSLYENVITDWGRPLDYLLTHDFGWTQYQSPLVVRPDTITEYRDCLKMLIPVFQQGWIDYMNDPVPMNNRILDIVEAQATFWSLSEQLNADAITVMRDLDIVSNGPDGTFGNFDMDRIQTLIDQIAPVFIEAGAEVKEGLRAEDIATNEFVDPSIGF